MNKNLRDIIIVSNTRQYRTNQIPCKIEMLHEVIASVDTVDDFCQAHELVNRNTITSKKHKILEAIKTNHLKSFRFLINKN